MWMILTVEWHRNPNTTITMTGVRIRPKTRAARHTFIAAITRFWAVTSTEHAQQSREPLSARGASPPATEAEYGGGTTTPELLMGVSSADVEPVEPQCWRWTCSWWRFVGSSSERSRGWWCAPFSRVPVILIVTCVRRISAAELLFRLSFLDYSLRNWNDVGFDFPLLRTTPRLNSGWVWIDKRHDHLSPCFSHVGSYVYLYCWHEVLGTIGTFFKNLIVHFCYSKENNYEKRTKYWFWYKCDKVFPGILY